MDYTKKVVVVGGGAAGMMAAISAARHGAEVTILEKNPRVGKKILATGNGRCNFTNINADVGCYSGENPEFVRKALSAFSVSDTISFFEKLGIQHKVEERGKVFPMSDQASSILDVLMYELNRLEVNIVCDSNVVEIIPGKGSFIIKTGDGRTYRADSVILAPGGKAMPSSGSDGYGYDLALKLGHTMTDIFPALVQLMLEGDFFKSIDGVKFVGTAEVLDNNRPVISDRGDILFTNYGVSGPPILQVSRKAGELMRDGKKAVLRISILDTMTKEEVSKLIEKRFQADPGKTVEFSFVGLTNKRLIPVILKQAGISDLKRPVSDITAGDRERIARILTDWRFSVRGTKSWPSAQVTAGGINTREIDDNTMESFLVKGLYFAGEIMDVDGLCGGFNLQWAWSSGFIAGRSAAV